MALSIPPRMEARLREYDAFHTSRANELCHWIGIPSIIAGAGSLLGAVPVVPDSALSLAELVLAAILVFYVVEARLLGVATTIAMAVFVALGRIVPPIGGIGLFLVGWAFQFFGHNVFEKRSPAFLRNLVHLLVGPAWLVEHALRKVVRWEVRSRPPT